MAPLLKSGARRLTLFFLFLLPLIGTGKAFHSPDSLLILRKDSLALNLFLSKPDSAIKLANEALEQATALQFRGLQGLNYYVLSKSHWAKANYKLSAQFGFKALTVFENTQHIDLWGKSLLSVGRTFIDLQNYDQARIYIERALKLSNINADDQLLAEAYREKSMLLSELKQYDSALFFADKGLAIFERLHDTLDMSILYGRKAKIHFYSRDFEKSSYYNKKCLVLDSLVGNRRALGVTYYQAALDVLHLGKYDSAIYLLKKGIAISKEIRNLSTLVKSHTLLGGIYLDQKKGELSAREFRMASQYKDSLYNAEKNGQVQEMQSLYELASKEETIEELARDNIFKKQQVRNQSWFVSFLLVCVLALAFGIFYLTRYRRLQEKSNHELESKNKSIEQQKEEILSQAKTLQQLNNLKSKLFSVISHDLRGPMATLTALLDLLTRRKLTPEEFMSVAGKLKNNLDVTQRTLDNLLNWALSQLEGIRTEPKVIHVKETIEEARRLMEETARRKRISIEVDVSYDLYASADAEQLNLILRNLLHNAIKFSIPSDTILVTAVRTGDQCVISVKDTGLGMTSQELETIGSSNYFSKMGTLQEKGTGLGLLLCKEFIKLNGGEISIKSAVNKGTEVTFTIPVAETFQDNVSKVLLN